MLLSWQQHFFNIVFITLISPGGLLAKKSEQDILREMHNSHTAIYFLVQKPSCFLAFYENFFCRACFATKMQIAYVAHKAPVIWPTKHSFPYLLLALLSDLEGLQVKG